ncbi:purine-nucleoside phosphorylase [Pseudotabrizicola formosa]|uniref:purine-nucleoside phosphorylase n=1 Tax=Pseudotabrizicola formosa TaxID=2030009 RepID=UPI000CD1F275|nr:purine-nucleoside phosphorylase [Pseudotabrizicola formosa]
MTFHIGANPGDIAETCLLPGDPYRARWAAERFLDGARLVSETRGMLAYTGTWRGNPVTLHGTGMGMPSLSIYANELIRDYNVQTLIRVGSCGALQPHIALRDIVLAQAASTIGSPSTSIFREMRFAPVADFGLLSKAYAAATAPVHVGGIYTSDTFYDERSDLTDQLQRHGCLAVEMETAELYTLAARYQRRALAILTVSDHVLTGAALPSAARETSFADMIQIALHAAFPPAHP